jgi:hypothetical protein
VADDGSRGPRPFQQHHVSTTFLRVPVNDWPAVKRGYKSEFRAGTGKNAVPQLWHLEPPCPVVAYCVRNGRHDHELMVLEELWREPLGAISPESLQREGFSSLAEFRTYWIAREHQRFRPTRMVFCYRVREWRSDDERMLADRLLSHLYGDFLDQVLLA